ncbi:MAG TPA: hypothetical protein VHP33_08180 [Polyangiaceae bacterium]|nr:hypothetical protein [Polyangiaceae bacterium]
MNAQVLVVLYVVVGLGLGGLVYARASERGFSRAASAVATVGLWPLWAPFALAPRPLPGAGTFSARITRALLQSGSGLPSAASVFSGVEAAEILQRVESSERRLADIDALLAARAQAEHTPGGDATRVGPAKARGDICLSSMVQLQAARAREQSGLEELAELCELLQMQHVLSRYESSDRTQELRDQLWARAQALSELREVG